MKELRIRNWDRWQSYRKDRGQPPWIKIHRRLMSDPNWVSLTDTQRGQLVMLWVLGADREGALPDDAATIRRLCHMTSTPNLKVFIERGFLERVTPSGCQVDANMTPSRRQHDAPETETETEADAAPNGAPSEEVQLFDRGKRILGPSSGGLIARLLKSKGGSVPLARAAIEQASTKQNAREYIGAIIRAGPAATARENFENPLAGII